jgi:hypothetical protein
VNFDLNNDGNAATDRTPGTGRNAFYMRATVSLDPRLTRIVRLAERARLQFIGKLSTSSTTSTSAAHARRSFRAHLRHHLRRRRGTPCLVPQSKLPHRPLRRALASCNSHSSSSFRRTPYASPTPKIVQIFGRTHFARKARLGRVEIQVLVVNWTELAHDGGVKFVVTLWLRNALPNHSSGEHVSQRPVNTMSKVRQLAGDPRLFRWLTSVRPPAQFCSPRLFSDVSPSIPVPSSNPVPRPFWSPAEVIEPSKLATAQDGVLTRLTAGFCT